MTTEYAAYPATEAARRAEQLATDRQHALAQVQALGQAPKPTERRA